MGSIAYTITSGYLPITVDLMVGTTIIDTNIHNVYESGEFNGIPEDEYFLRLTDSNGCIEDSVQLGLCDCEEGYTPIIGGCVQVDVQEATYTGTTYTIIKKANNDAYSVYGAVIFDSWNYDGTGTYEGFGLSPLNQYWANQPYPSIVGVMNRGAVWASTTTNDQDIGFSFCINIAVSKTYYIGFGCDNWGKIKLNGTYILEQDRDALKSMFSSSDDGIPFKYWYIYPVEFPAGQNVVEVYGHNELNVAAVGIEIYNATKEDLINATSDADLSGKLLFRSSDLVGEALYYEYSTGGGYHGYYCGEGYALDTCGETVRCVKNNYLPCGTTTTTTTTVEPTTTTTSTSSTTTTTTTIVVYTACEDFQPYFET